MYIPYRYRLRTPTPALTTLGTFAVNRQSNATIAITSMGINGGNSTRDGVVITVTVASGLVLGEAVQLIANNDATCYLNFDARL